MQSPPQRNLALRGFALILYDTMAPKSSVKQALVVLLYQPSFNKPFSSTCPTSMTIKTFLCLVTFLTLGSATASTNNSLRYLDSDMPISFDLGKVRCEGTKARGPPDGDYKYAFISWFLFGGIESTAM